MGEMRVQLCFLDFVHTSKHFYHFSFHSLIKYKRLIFFFLILYRISDSSLLGYNHCNLVTGHNVAGQSAVSTFKYTLKMRAEGSSYSYHHHITQYHNPDDDNPNFHSCENLKFCILL